MNKKPAAAPAERCVVCHAVEHVGYIDHEWVPFTPKPEAASKPAPSPAERWIDCGHNECKSRSSAASGWPCIFAGKYETSVGPIGAASECPAVWDTTEGALRCDLSAGHGDWHRPSENVMRELLAHDAALRAALKKAEHKVKLVIESGVHEQKRADAAVCALATLQLKYDELHDQRHAEARKADAALTRVAELEKALRELHGRLGLCRGAIYGLRL